MKKKISMVLAGLGLCASLMMFNTQDAAAQDCFYYPSTKCPSTWGECCYEGGSDCMVVKCFKGTSQ